MPKTTKGKLLIVDDSPDLLVAFRYFLSPYFDEVRTEQRPDRMLSLLKAEAIDLILLDMNFAAGVNTGNEGFYWMQRILEIDPAATIVLITAYGDIELAVRAIKQGATDFIHKSWDEEKILSTVLSAYRHRQSRLEIERLKNRQNLLIERENNGSPVCYGISKSMMDVHSLVEKVAATDANILILGENGTGKEVIAREIHRLSNRSNEIFVTVDVGAIPEPLFESELFGYCKGAFTDAKADKPGRFEVASGGTLFLDEIGNIPLHLQAKLLSVIQNGAVIRLGSNKPIPIDIRLICATNLSPYSMVEEGSFREDLLYRINTVQVDLPPLRERKEDIPYLVKYIMPQFVKKYNKSPMTISNEAIQRLQEHPWKGNIRELKHQIEKAVILTDSDTIQPSDIVFNPTKENVVEFNDLNLEKIEMNAIRTALKKHSSNIRQAAIELGINRSTLYEKIKKYNL